MDRIKVLSLFDGMSCAMLAMIGTDIPVERYVAYEIDKYAVKTASHNFPEIEQRGDVFDADFTEFKGFDYLMGGSPCTYWSIAQKNNRETEASGMGWELFSQYVRALKEAEPRYFVYENNKSMSNAIRQSITDAFGFEPILINSALVSAQNRQRLYWVGKRNSDGTYSKVEIDQPEDRGLLLKDILENGIVEKDKAYCLKHQAGNARDDFKKHHTQIKFEPVCVAQRGRYADSGNRTVKGNGPIEQFYEAREDGKTNALTTVQKDNYVAEPVAINTTDDGDKARTLMAGYYKYGTATLITNEGFKGGTTAVAEPIRIPEYGSDDKSRPLNAHYSNNCGGFEHRMFSENPNKQQVDMIADPIYIGEVPEHNGNYRNGKQPSQQYRVYDTEGKGVAVTTCAITNVAEPVNITEDGKSVNINAGGGGAGGKTGLYAVPVQSTINVGSLPGSDGEPSKSQSAQIYSVDGKSSNLCANGGGLGAKTGLYAIPVEYEADIMPCYAQPCEWDDDGKPIKAISFADGKEYTVYEVKDGLITIKDKQYPIKLADGLYIIRKLTVRECMRLQTVPEWYEFPVSDSQAYKMLGNGWTVEVIVWLLMHTK